MGIFGRTKQIMPSVDSKAADEEKEEAAKKARLLETEGGNKGAELQANQGANIRKIFGN